MRYLPLIRRISCIHIDRLGPPGLASYLCHVDVMKDLSLLTGAALEEHPQAIVLVSIQRWRGMFLPPRFRRFDSAGRAEKRLERSVFVTGSWSSRSDKPYHVFRPDLFVSSGHLEHATCLFCSRASPSRGSSRSHSVSHSRCVPTSSEQTHAWLVPSFSSVASTVV